MLTEKYIQSGQHTIHLGDRYLPLCFSSLSLTSLRDTSKAQPLKRKYEKPMDQSHSTIPILANHYSLRQLIDLWMNS